MMMLIQTILFEDIVVEDTKAAVVAAVLDVVAYREFAAAAAVVVAMIINCSLYGSSKNECYTLDKRIDGAYEKLIIQMNRLYEIERSRKA